MAEKIGSNSFGCDDNRFMNAKIDCIEEGKPFYKAEPTQSYMSTATQELRGSIYDYGY